MGVRGMTTGGANILATQARGFFFFFFWGMATGGAGWRVARLQKRGWRGDRPYAETGP